MSEKLFSRLYWRPYMFIGLSILLVFISSLIPYVLPHAWLAQRYPGYDLYMFKGMAWLIKLSMLLYIFCIYQAMAKNYFPKLPKLCSEETRAVITGYKKTWSRGSQLCPIFTYNVDGTEYSEALNESKGSRTKTEETIDRGFTLKLPRKIFYNPKNPTQFFVPGEEYYSRKAAIFRFVIFSALFFLQLYLNVFIYVR